MLYGMINEQGHLLYIRDAISEKNDILHMFFRKSLDSGVEILGIKSLMIIKPLYLRYRCYK